MRQAQACHAKNALALPRRSVADPRHVIENASSTLEALPGEGTLRHRTPSQGLQALQALHISSNFPTTLATLATLTRNPLKLLAILQG